MTECECDIGGWCERHKMLKTDHLNFLCKTNPKYFAQWEKGYGPGQGTPPPTNPHLRIKEGPGTELKKILARLRMSEYSGCACKLRVAQMNAWGTEVCRQRIDDIVAWLEEAAGKFNWITRMAVSFPGIREGSRAIIKKLVMEAIENAEKREEMARLHDNSTS